MVVNVPKETLALPLNDVPVYAATDLSKGGNLAQIKLSDQLYTLRITNSGKLILTK